MAKRYVLCKCGTRNDRAGGRRKCVNPDCGKALPKVRVPKHREVLRDTPFARFAELSVEIHGGELHACGCCRRQPTKVKRHDRDHDHRTGKARGLACSFCNRERLRGIANLEEARWVVAYFERVEKYQTGRGEDVDTGDGG